MPRVDLQKYNKKVENPVAILWRLVCYFKHCRLLLTAAMLSILAYVAATIGAAYCMKPLTNLLESSGAAPNETYAKYISLILGLAGLYLLCLAGHDTLTLTGGEWMLLLCSLLFAFQIMLVDHYSPRLDGVQLSFAEFFATAVLSTIFMFVFETPTFAQIQGAAVSIAYCGILSSGVAYTLQIVGQKELDPTIASMAMCMESVFSALAGWLILGQTLSGVELAGCALMFAAIIGAQIPEKVRS